MFNFNKESNIKMFSVFLLFLLIKVIKTEIKCGIPGNTLKSVVKPVFNNERVVENGKTVKYSCDFNDAPFLIGYNERECIDGEWNKPIPKCATLYTGKYELNSTHNNNAINISLTESARIVGIVARLSSYEPIEVMNIQNIESPDCFVANTTVRDNNKVFSANKRRYTTLFHCPTKEVNVWSQPPVFWILMTFNEKIRNCEPDGCPAVLEFIELYEISEDQCLKPDVPAFGKLIPIKKSGSVPKYKYQCEDYFDMSLTNGRQTEVICDSNQEWTPTALPKCIPKVKCFVQPIDELKVSYNWLWTDTEAVVGTVASFECINNSTKLNGTAKRECNPSSEWSEELPNCIQIITTTTAMTTTTVETTVPPTMRYETTTQPIPIIVYATQPNPLVPPTNVQSNYPTQNLNPYPSSYPTSAVPYYPQQKDQPMSGQSLSTSHFVYIFLGILLGILITIGVIYYIQQRRNGKSSANTSVQANGPNNGRPVRDDMYFSHFNNIRDNYNESQISNTFLSNQSVENSHNHPYDSSNYIQIEAVEDMRIDSITKYENYERKHPRKPLPDVPK